MTRPRRIPNALLGEVVREVAEADAKHGEDGIARLPMSDPRWTAILTEEIGEVAQAWLDQQLVILANPALREELIQVAAVALAWVAAIDTDSEPPVVTTACVLHLGNGCSCPDCASADAVEVQWEIDREESR